MNKINNPNETYTHEVVYTLKRIITLQNQNIIGVSRSFEVNGKRIYMDNISRDAWHNSLENPDIFRLVELFSMGIPNIGNHTTYRAENRKYFIKLIKCIGRKLRFHKLYFYIKFFKLR